MALMTELADRVRLEVDGPVATIVNAYPDKLNAFDDVMDEQLFAVLHRLMLDPDIRVVVWRAEGRAFSTGRDVGAMARPVGPTAYDRYLLARQQNLRRLLEMPIPIIVAIRGWAIGAGFQRALLADIRIAGESARFRLPEVTFGVIPDAGGIARLHQMCGHGLTADLVLTGRELTAAEALHHGIVSRLVADHEVESTAYAVAERIANAPEFAVRGAKTVLDHLASPSVARSLDVELVVQQWVRRAGAPDAAS